MQICELMTEVATLRRRGVRGDALHDALETFEFAPEVALDATDALRTVYTDSTRDRPLARWALLELDSEICELEELGLGY